MEDKDTTHDQSRLIAMSAQIVSAYVQHNAFNSNSLPQLLADVHVALKNLTDAPKARPIEMARPVPAVPIRKSVSPSLLVCLECGRKFQTIKRHLQTEHGLSPESYKEKWGLPGDYPTVAPEYAARRAELAMGQGLGREPSRSPESRPGKSKG